MIAKWIGKEDAPDGFGQFENDGPLIHFNSFKDYFYLQRLFDIRKNINFNAGRRDVLNTVRNYVEGMK